MASMEPEHGATAPKAKFRWQAFLPVVIFAVLSAVFAYLLLQPGRDAATLPSALMGQKAPQSSLLPIDGLAGSGFEIGDIEGLRLVNFWASWCGPCRQEHPLLVAMQDDQRFSVVGVNYKDAPANAVKFIGDLGNPYAHVGADPNGRVAIEWGVYGMPETFLLDGDGVIVWKHVGPLTAEIVADRLLPEIAKRSQ